jgi:hypothetical protein
MVKPGFSFIKIFNHDLYLTDTSRLISYRYITKNAGEFYDLAVVATSSRDVNATMGLIIRVAEYNRYPPQFERLNYT